MRWPCHVKIGNQPSFGHDFGQVKFEEVSPKPPFVITSGYPFVTDKKSSAEDKVAAYKKAVEKVEPSLGTVMENAAKIPGAAVIYRASTPTWCAGRGGSSGGSGHSNGPGTGGTACCAGSLPCSLTGPG